MKNLIIIGAGGYGREAFTLAKNSIGYGQEFLVKGFLDSNLKALGDMHNYPPVLDTIENYQILNNDIFICAIGDVELRKKTVNEVLQKGGVFTNLIHNSVYLGDNVNLGVGIFIAYDVVISNDTTIEDYVLINSRALIGHDCHIGQFSSIGVYSFVGGGVSIGSGCSIHSKSSVKNNLHISDGVNVGMGSVVIKNVTENSTVFGNPAKKVF